VIINRIVYVSARDLRDRDVLETWAASDKPNFDKRADLAAAETEVQRLRDRQRAIAGEISDITAALRPPAIVATTVASETRQAKLKTRLAAAEREREELSGRERELVGMMDRLRSEHKAVIEGPLRTARLAGALRLLAARSELQAAHDHLDGLKTVARGARSSVQKAPKPPYLNASVAAIKAIVRECALVPDHLKKIADRIGVLQQRQAELAREYDDTSKAMTQVEGGPQDDSSHAQVRARNRCLAQERREKEA
jgi:hypothetical protein